MLVAGGAISTGNGESDDYSHLTERRRHGVAGYRERWGRGRVK